MAAAQLRTLLNGPVVAGVGATVDAGLPTSKYHVLPWDPIPLVQRHIHETAQGIKLSSQKDHAGYDGTVEDLLSYAVWNVNNVLRIDEVTASSSTASAEFKDNVKLDAIAIVFLCMAYGYYYKECRMATEKEHDEIMLVDITEEFRDSIINTNRLNRAATFVLARMHTKYQTNHAIGGNPMQASMASSVRAFYGLSPGSARAQSAVSQLKTVADMLYWAVHPANETLLIPCVIQNSKIPYTFVHAQGPRVELVVIEEYFQIRARTPPSSTHHFYVAAASVKQLEPLGILPYLPQPSRTKDIVDGLRMIERYGAQLHPAARFWGMERMTANQKLVESLCADLGYAVKKLMPASSLAASPILQKEDALDSSWRAFIDALRAAMDERGKELLSSEVFSQIQKAVAPTASQLEGIPEIKGYLTGGKVTEADDDDDDSDEEDAPSDKAAGKQPEVAPVQPTTPPRPTGQRGNSRSSRTSASPPK